MRLMICVALVLLVASVGIVLAADQAVDANLTTLDKLDAASTPVTVKSPTATLNSVLNLLSTVGGFEVEIRWSPIPGAAPEGPLGKKTFAVDWDKISMRRFDAPRYAAAASLRSADREETRRRSAGELTAERAPQRPVTAQLCTAADGRSGF